MATSPTATAAERVERPPRDSRTRGLLIASAGVLVLVLAASVAWWQAPGGGEGEETAAVQPPPVAPAARPPRGSGRVAGFVRDSRGRPVPGARIDVSGSRRRARADRRGRYEIVARAGRRTIVARHPSYARDSVSTIVRRGRSQRLDLSLAITAPKLISERPDSADRVISWTGCDRLSRMSDAELGRYIALGLSGFVCVTGPLGQFGGLHSFTGAKRIPAGKHYALQRRLRRSALVRRARAGQIKLYLGFYLVNPSNTSTPLADWFDDGGWSRRVLPQVRNAAAAARSLGFAGVAVDQELYPQKGGATTASWSWEYPGNDRSEDEVRAQVRRRGRQLMRTMGAAFPGLEVVAYATELPETWAERVQELVNDSKEHYASDVRIDLWNGISSVQRYSAIRWMDATFYKVHTPAGSWDAALQYNANRVYSLLSRRFANWPYASRRLHVSPFSWIDAGPSDFERARDPGHVAEQLRAFRRWGAGGSFANYSFNALDEFDYGPYAASLRAAGRPGAVDVRPPVLAVSAPTAAPRYRLDGDRLDLAGTAVDDLAVRAVRWHDNRGRWGTASLLWEVISGDDRSGRQWRMRWTINALPVPRGTTRITITAEDIKGLAATRTLTVTR